MGSKYEVFTDRPPHKEPLPQDSNRHTGLDSVTKLGGDVRTVTNAAWVPLVFPIDIKKCSLVVTSGTLLVRFAEPIGVVYLAAAAITDEGAGEVMLTTGENHLFTVGDNISLVGTTNYDGDDFPLLAGTATDKIQIAATFVAETPTTAAYAIGYRDLSYAVNEGFNSPGWIKAMDTTWCKVKGSGGDATFRVQVGR